MRYFFILYIFFSASVPIYSQIIDNFSDGNFTENLTWEGTTADFIINEAEQLQLNAESSGASSIYTSVNLQEKMEWQFFLQMDFNPSTSNLARIYLQSDDIDLLNGSGYFLEIGETGNDDALNFYRQDSGNITLLTSATLGAVASNPTISVRIARNNNGDWQLFADYSGGTTFVLEATTNDATYLQDGTYTFGFYCKYSSTRTEDFFFDDIIIQPLSEDNTPPLLTDIIATDEKTVILTFSESINEINAVNTTNYTINQGIGTPSEAILAASNQVILSISDEFIANEVYTISIENIVDLAGNSLSNFDTVFTFLKVEVAEQYDIIINEIMEDASLSGGGTLGLPDEEYVELYNRSDKTINLEGFTFSDGSSNIATFPFYQMAPKTYLVIGKTSASSLSDFGNFLGLSSFPTLSSVEELVLKNEFGEAIDVVSYTQDWYGNSTTAGGSYSLERINPNNPCVGSANWQGATAILGGTPGKENSMIDVSLAVSSFNLVDAYPLDAMKIRLTFDKNISIEDLMDVSNYTITNYTITDVVVSGNNFNQVILQLQNPLVANQIETISLTTSFSDCLGNPIDGQSSHPISLPVMASSRDILLNEILFNPQTGGSDFLELFNHSNKVIDLNDLLLANQALENPQFKPIEIQKLLFPNDFAVLTENPADIINRYTVEQPTAVYLQDLPTFEDNNGNVLLYTINGTETITIDEFDYLADFHNPLLNDKNGVSLERLNPNLPTQDGGNWFSASTSVGSATPTYQNSQQIIAAEESNDIFSLSNNRISPDGDGFEDFLQINYQTDQNGYAATIQIFDAAGRLIDKVAQNESLATIGSFRWEGVTLDGQRARTGIYVLWIEYVNLNGEVGHLKEAIVVAERL